MKKNGPRTDPCGTPHFTDFTSDLAPRAGRTGPTIIALPRLQTAPKIGAQSVRVGQMLNYRSQPVGPQRNKDDRREYVQGGV